MAGWLGVGQPKICSSSAVFEPQMLGSSKGSQGVSMHRASHPPQNEGKVLCLLLCGGCTYANRVWPGDINALKFGMGRDGEGLDS